MNLNLVRDEGVVTTGPIIFAYFEPGSLGLVFQRYEEGPALGGRIDPELMELYWFDLVDGQLRIPSLGPIESWEIAT